jgi:hypothetical protein
MKPQVYWLLLGIALGHLSQLPHAQADTYAPPMPQYFVSESHYLLFKTVPPQRATAELKSGGWGGESIGVLSRSQSDGKEQEIWRGKLVNMPPKAYVSDQGNAVITIGNWGPPQDKHSVVVYGAKGEVLADYSPEDLLTVKELQKYQAAIQYPGKQSVALLWLHQAQFSFLDSDLFVIRFGKEGAFVVIDLKTGNARREDGLRLPRKHRKVSEK